MSNSTFTTAAAGTPPSDPSKHVNYTQGMVLGVDDFQQEFAYLSNRDQWLARDAIGYGTVCGLHVSLDPAVQNRISVSPGVAINPRGQLIRVAPEQCARLDSWLALPDTIGQLQEVGIGGTGEFSAYVVLCYRDCPADELPVPGEPCRCDSTTMAPSRIIDDFRLELTLERPLQLEEDVVRRLVEWLRLIPVVEDFDSPPGGLDAFLQAIKDVFLTEVGSPPEAPSIFFPDSPPSGLYIPHSQFCEWMRAAMRLWVTELRPIWQVQCARKKQCACGGPCGCHGTGAPLLGSECECLLLAEVVITRSSGGITGVTVDESGRPFVVHLRMLQELLLCGPCCGEMGDAGSPPSSPAQALVGDVTGPPHQNQLQSIQGKPLDLAGLANQKVLGFNNGKWVPVTLPAGSNVVPNDAVLVAENAFSAGGSLPKPGSSPAFARADHTHGVPPDPIKPHLLNTTAHLSHEILGDVSKTLGATIVSRLQGVPVSTTKPAKDEILQFDLPTSTWTPKKLPAGGFVEHPPDAGFYGIVAAGILNPSGTKVSPSYCNLRVLTGPTNGIVRLTFDHYAPPSSSNAVYIVKGTSMGARQIVFHVVDFDDQAFRIQFAAQEAAISLMIEVSMFFQR